MVNTRYKELLTTSFGLFALFFGAGNLLIPPLLGYTSGNNWVLVALGFMLTAVIIPILGILAHAKLQGTLYDFAKHVSPLFSKVYCVLIYSIAIAIPSPRTAAATHEIAIAPIINTSALSTSCIYFLMVFIAVLNRTSLLNLIGKFLTPFIVLMLLAVIGIGLLTSKFTTIYGVTSATMASGILEGYQTFDAIAAVVVGAVVIVSINLKTSTHYNYKSKRALIRTSGLIAGLGLFMIYGGLIAVGAYYSSQIHINQSLSNGMQRASLLRSISTASLGEFGNAVLSILIALACFTTAIGIIAGTADYFKSVHQNSKTAYVITALIGCMLGVVVGQLNFNTIIEVAIPILLFIYPITIVLILLNVVSSRYTKPVVFKYVVFSTFIFSIPDVISSLTSDIYLRAITSCIPLSDVHLGWVLPAIIAFIISTNFNANKKY